MTWIKTFLILIVALYILVGLYLFLFQERLMFRARQLATDFTFRFEADFDELNLEMEDGAVLNALHFKRRDSKGLILYFHGNAGDLSRWGEIVLPFTDYGYEVLVVDYRGYGKSTGERSKENMLADAELIYAQAAALYPQERIIIYGRSLGGTFATHVASKFDPGALVLESPFYSVQDVARRYAWMYPLKPMLKFNFDNSGTINQVSCPITIIHGDEDGVVPISSGVKLKAQRNDIEFFTIEGGGHNNLADYKKYWEVIKKQLQ